MRRQARQAARYRTISAVIRGAEADVLSLQHARAEAARLAAETAKIAAHRAVAEATGAATRAATLAAETASALPALREAEAVARTALERHRLGLEQMTAEIGRARAAMAQARQLSAQLDTDLAHAGRQQGEADAAIARLDEEAARLAAEAARHPPLAQEAQEMSAAAIEATRALEADCNRATEHAADLSARARAAQEALGAAEHRVRKLQEQHARILAERRQLLAGAVPPARLQEAVAEAAAAATQAQAAHSGLSEAEAARTAAFAQAAILREQATAEQARLRAQARARAEAIRQEAAAALAQARAAATAAHTAGARLAAERQALAEILGVSDTERWPRMVDQLTVPAGLETALGAALGEELESAADLAASRHWRVLPPLDPLPPLPPGVTPLDQLVLAPPALARALSQIGLAGDEPDPSGLAPGQILVSRDGAVWRWDGYTVRAGTQTQAAVRLQQGRRLASLTADLVAATAAAEQTRTGLAAAEAADRDARRAADVLEQDQRAQADAAEQRARFAAKTAEDTASQAERIARAARDQAEQRLTRARAQAAQLATQAATFTARAEGLSGQETRLAAELAEATAQFETVHAQCAAIADPSAARADVERLRAALGLARAHEKSAGAALDGLTRGAEARQARLARIGPDRTDWTARLRDAAERATDLAARTQAARLQLDQLEAAPDALARRASAATEALDLAEATHRRHATALTDAETAAQSADRAARAADQATSAAREALVRAESDATQADHVWGTVAERVLDRLGTTATLPPPPPDHSPEAEDRLRRRHDKLLREREEMGPVNLRAEIEAQDIETRIGAISRERDELATAIAKLRGSIGHLNREGRERLAAVFTEVDGHFQALFARMFGGGKAHLALVGTDDPLTAGLEIYAQPPGKKLAALSLLSGGEQALCALSLIFAVFRCNPAPICVLDEVDAPLDDANVDRFCTLLEDMVRDTNTRFLVVTHHALTMARMDRLYGVTMQERGVSRLLSVDLQRAEAMVAEPAVQEVAA